MSVLICSSDNTMKRRRRNIMLCNVLAFGDARPKISTGSPLPGGGAACSRLSFEEKVGSRFFWPEQAVSQRVSGLSWPTGSLACSSVLATASQSVRCGIWDLYAREFHCRTIASHPNGKVLSCLQSC